MRQFILMGMLCLPLFGFSQSICDSLQADFQVSVSGLTVTVQTTMDTNFTQYTYPGGCILISFYDFGGAGTASDSSSFQFGPVTFTYDQPGTYQICYYVTCEASAFPICDSLVCKTVTVDSGASSPTLCDSLRGDFAYQINGNQLTVQSLMDTNSLNLPFPGNCLLVAFYDFGGAGSAVDSNTTMFGPITYAYDSIGTYQVCHYVTCEQSAQPICDSLFCTTISIDSLLTSTERKAKQHAWSLTQRDHLVRLDVGFEDIPLSVWVRTLTGQTIWVDHQYEGKWISLEPFPSGIYWVQAKGNQGIFSQKIIR